MQLKYLLFEKPPGPGSVFVRGIAWEPQCEIRQSIQLKHLNLKFVNLQKPGSQI